MKTVSFAITAKEPASRAELVIRLAWCVLLALVLWVMQMIGLFVWAGQFLVILARKRRSRTLNGYLKAYSTQIARYSAYATMTTDERPPLFPE